MLVMTGGLGVAAMDRRNCVITLKRYVFEHHMYIGDYKEELVFGTGSLLHKGYEGTVIER